MPGSGCRYVCGELIVVGLIEVVQGRYGEERLGRDRVHPIGDDKGVAFCLRVAQAIGSVVAAHRLPVCEARIVRHVEV